MKKFWYELNKTIFRISLGASIIQVLILTIIISTTVGKSSDSPVWGIFLAFLILIFGSFYVIMIHSVWGLIIEYIGTVYEMRDDVGSLENKSSKNDDFLSHKTVYSDSVKRCSRCGEYLKENDIVCLHCGKTVDSLLETSPKPKILESISNKYESSNNNPRPNTWKCPNCETINSEYKRYCVNCKQERLTKICPNCNKIVDLKTPICPNCKQTFSKKHVVRCKRCGTEIREGQTLCDSCQENKQNTSENAIPTNAPQQNIKIRTCYYCRKQISPFAKICSFCGKAQPDFQQVTPAPSEEKVTQPVVESSEKICQCGAKMPAGSKFCGICGRLIHQKIICPKCGNVVPSGYSFCINCGQSVSKTI